MKNKYISLLVFFITISLYADGIMIQTEWVKSGGGHSLTADLEFSPNGKYLGYANTSGVIKVWDANNGNLAGSYSDFNFKNKKYKNIRSIPGMAMVHFSKDSQKVYWNSWAFVFERWNIGLWKRDWEHRFGKRFVSLVIDSDESIVAGISVNDIEIYDMKSWKKIRRIKAHKKLITRLAITKDAKYIISVSKDRITKIWEVKTGRLVRSHKKPYRTIAVSPDRKTYAATTNKGNIDIYEILGKKPLKTIKNKEGYISDMVYSKNGYRLYVSKSNGYVEVWNINEASKVKTIDVRKKWPYAKPYQSPSLWKIAIHPDQKTLATGSMKGVVQLWDVESGKPLRVIKGHNSSVGSVKYSPDGKMIASVSTDYTVRIWNAKDGGFIRYMDLYTPVNSVAFSPDSGSLAVGGNSRRVFLYDTKTWKIPVQLLGHSGKISRIVYRPDGKQIATMDTNKTIKIWNPENGKELFTFKSPFYLLNIAYSPNGKNLAAAGKGKKVIILDSATGKQTASLSIRPNVFWISYSPDGQNIALGCTDNNIYLLDLTKKGKIIKILRGHKRSLAPVIYSKDGKYLYSSSWDGSLIVWDVKTGKAVVKKELFYSTLYELSLSPDGKRMAFGSGTGDVGVFKISE